MVIVNECDGVVFIGRHVCFDEADALGAIIVEVTEARIPQQLTQRDRGWGETPKG